MLRFAVAVLLSASVTFTVKLDVPVAEGVPEITPVLAFSVRPAGKLPLLMLHVYGVTPPVAVTVAEYATFTVPDGSDVVVIISVAGLIVMLRFAVAVLLSASVTFTVKLEVSTVVGVPDITPVLAFSVSPAGKLPLLMLHV
jgi:hypothetical protein